MNREKAKYFTQKTQCVQPLVRFSQLYLQSHKWEETLGQREIL
jgi:hypothetical protein